jgi:hypothetical protein
MSIRYVCCHVAGQPTFRSLAGFQPPSAVGCNRVRRHERCHNEEFELYLAATTPDQPRLESTGIFQNLGFELLELSVQNGTLNIRTQGFVAGFGALLLNDGQHRLAELDSVCSVTHDPSS